MNHATFFALFFFASVLFVQVYMLPSDTEPKTDNTLQNAGGGPSKDLPEANLKKKFWQKSRPKNQGKNEVGATGEVKKGPGVWKKLKGWVGIKGKDKEMEATQPEVSLPTGPSEEDGSPTSTGAKKKEPSFGKRFKGLFRKKDNDEKTTEDAAEVTPPKKNDNEDEEMDVQAQARHEHFRKIDPEAPVDTIAEVHHDPIKSDTVMPVSSGDSLSKFGEPPSSSHPEYPEKRGRSIYSSSVPLTLALHRLPMYKPANFSSPEAHRASIATTRSIGTQTEPQVAASEVDITEPLAFGGSEGNLSSHAGSSETVHSNSSAPKGGMSLASGRSASSLSWDGYSTETFLTSPLGEFNKQQGTHRAPTTDSHSPWTHGPAPDTDFMGYLATTAADTVSTGPPSRASLESFKSAEAQDLPQTHLHAPVSETHATGARLDPYVIAFKESGDITPTSQSPVPSDNVPE